MKGSKRFIGGCAALLVSLVSCPGQFYAPDSEFHDPVQRVFVVEAARVLAWRANRHGGHVAEVTYQVSTRTNGATVWEVVWRDTDGKALKSARVEYEISALKQGNAFYRQVMRQLASADWPVPPATTASAAISNFWGGASLAGLSREESLVAGYTIVQGAKTGKDPDPAQMAGLLLHSALPGTAGHLSLDPVLAARGAAWLSVAEQGCSNELSRLWAPVLFLAGRVEAARASWKAPKPETSGSWLALERAWELWLKQPTSKEAFLFAADSTNVPMATAMLAYDVAANNSGPLWAEIFQSLAGSESMMTRMHNYAPLLARSCGVGGGHIMNGAWPMFQRQAWLATLKAYASCPDAKKDLDYTSTLDGVMDRLRKAGEPEASLDACLFGLKEAAPLLRLGYEKGTGKLVPTAIASAADLLNYGWEATGLQMGSRYAFVARKWGVAEQANPIVQTTLREVQGLVPFFLTEQKANTYNYRQSQLRLQHVDGLRALAGGWSQHPFGADARNATNAGVFAKRSWLRPTEFEWQARCLWEEHRLPEISALVEEFLQEGGALGARWVLEYLTSVDSQDRAALPRINQLMAALAEKLPQPSTLYVRAVFQERFKPKPILEIAQEMERLYWRNPDSELDEFVFWNYGQAGAYKAARRFYTQARKNFLDPVRISNRIGPMVMMAGYLLEDPELREMALEDSACGSYRDMTLHIWEAAIRGNEEELKDQVRELIQRYESRQGPESEGRRLLRFLPLLPALKDPKHPSREQALNYFEKNPNWNVLRWIWIQKFKLPKEDAIALLGGRETETYRRVLVCCLEGDRKLIEEANDQFEKEKVGSGDQAFLIAYLVRKAQGKPPVDDVPDLMPPGASSTRAAVTARLKAKGK